jgi:hypothetical protein
MFFSKATASAARLGMRAILLGLVLLLFTFTAACGGPAAVVATPTPTYPLGEEMRSDMGGFTYRAVPGFVQEEFFGVVSLMAPDADPENGPMLLLVGGTREERLTPEEIYQQLSDQGEFELSATSPVTVGGKQGIQFDMIRDVEGVRQKARVVLVMVTEAQEFNAIAAAPESTFDADIVPVLDAMLGQITFFEPEEPSFDLEP